MATEGYSTISSGATLPATIRRTKNTSTCTCTCTVTDIDEVFNVLISEESELSQIGSGGDHWTTAKVSSILENATS